MGFGALRQKFNIRGKQGANIIIAGIVGLSAVGIGIILYNVKAASTVVSSEAEAGTRSAKAISVSDNSASGSTAVKFNAVSGGSCASSTPNTFDGPDGNGGCWPGAATTGVPPGTSLTQVTASTTGTGWYGDSGGSIHVNADNAVINAMLVTGAIYNPSDYKITVTSTKIKCVGEDSFCVNLGSNSIVRDTEIGGLADGVSYTSARGIYTGGSNANNLIERCNIHHLMTGIVIDGGTTVKDTWVHNGIMGDPAWTPTGTRTDLHSSPIMSTRYGNVTITHSSFEGGNTAGIFVQHDVTDSSAPAITAYTLTDSLVLNGSRNGQLSTYGFWVQPSGVTGPITMTNNVFGRGWEIGPYSVPSGISTVSGNKYTDGTVLN